jgi:hypothetical protein
LSGPSFAILGSWSKRIDVIEINDKTDLDALRHVQTIDRMLDRALTDNQQLKDEDYRLHQELSHLRSVARSRLVFMLMYAAMLFLTWFGLALKAILG